MANPFVHVELQTGDKEASKAFYGALFGWRMQDVPGDYTIIDVGEGTGGGIMQKPCAEIPDNWMPYVLVDDVSASTEKSLSLGASVLKDKTEVPGMGWFSVIKDPTGAVLGLWQTSTNYKCPTENS